MLGLEQEVTCKVCSSPANLFDVVDFNKSCSRTSPYARGLRGIPIYYYRCQNCRFIFTQYFDTWNDKQFFKEIYNSDYVNVDPDYLIKRPKETANLFLKYADSVELDSPVLDYGSGSGAFARELRSAGFTTVSSYDPFSTPERPRGKFKIITCFEVIEHAPDPRKLFSNMIDLLTDDGVIILGTALAPTDVYCQRADWWYIAPRNGHVSIFTDEAMKELGKLFGLHYAKGDAFFCFTRTLQAPQAVAGFGFLPWHCVLLGSDIAAKDCWHGAELDSRRNIKFRWSSVPKIEWDLHFQFPYQIILKVTIPYINVIRPDYLYRPKIYFDNQLMGEACVVRDEIETLSATGKVQVKSELRQRITLELPSPISPSSLNINQDKRILGIAVPEMQPKVL
jgi:SAM-dependent methyltransferase